MLQLADIIIVLILSKATLQLTERESCYMTIKWLRNLYSPTKEPIKFSALRAASLLLEESMNYNQCSYIVLVRQAYNTLLSTACLYHIAAELWWQRYDHGCRVYPSAVPTIYLYGGLEFGRKNFISFVGTLADGMKYFFHLLQHEKLEPWAHCLFQQCWAFIHSTTKGNTGVFWLLYKVGPYIGPNMIPWAIRWQTTSVFDTEERQAMFTEKTIMRAST